MPKNKQHHYFSNLKWHPGDGETTLNYKNYSRNHIIEFKGKDAIEASSDPSFLGDPSRHNPEEMLLASLSSCHMLWYLHLAGTHGVEILNYVDQAEAIMEEDPDIGGRFIKAILKPVVTITKSSPQDVAFNQHEGAHHKCFIANSVNFPVLVEAKIVTD